MTDAVLTTVLRNRKHKQGQSPLKEFKRKDYSSFPVRALLMLGYSLRERTQEAKGNRVQQQ